MCLHSLNDGDVFRSGKYEGLSHCVSEPMLRTITNLRADRSRSPVPVAPPYPSWARLGHPHPTAHHSPPTRVARAAGICMVAQPASLCDRAFAVGNRSAISHYAASNFQVSTTLSGFNEMDVIPCSTSHLAKSGWSLGHWPQMPTNFYSSCQFRTKRPHAAQ